MSNSSEELSGVVVVATDNTSLVEAQKIAEQEKSLAKMITLLVQNQRHAQSFVRESLELLTQAEKALLNYSSWDQVQTPVQDLYRWFHTLKGGAATFSVEALVRPCHELESFLAKPLSEVSLIDVQSYLKKARMEFENFLKSNEILLGKPDRWSQRWIEIPFSKVTHFDAKWLQRLPPPSLLRAEFLEEFLLEPVENFFVHFDSVLQTTCKQLGKKVSPLKFQGGRLLIFPEPYSTLFATFVHAFRNAADHAIETPDIRLSRNKPEEGMVVVKFSETQIWGEPALEIRIVDDGGGIDPERVRAKLLSRGINPLTKTDEQVIQHIFDVNLSTKDTVSDISGRGVGLDALLGAAKELGGTAWVESVVGEGTQLVVQVPWFKTPEQTPLLRAQKPKSA